MLNQNQDTLDQACMAEAMQLALRGLYSTDPNPRVGCVLLKDEKIIGRGWHQRVGEAHAEINALEDARIQRHDIRGATAYVTLEPCCHQGRTGPCTEALIEAGIRRVVYGMEDPNPRVAGQGLQQLSQAGIEIIGPIQENSARQLNPGFIKRMRDRLPFVRVKMAMSVDGRTAMASGESKWITSEPARHDVQRLRARSSAVITGIGTVLYDNPALTVRPEEIGLTKNDIKQPLRVVLDSHNRLPGQARILHGGGEVLQVLAIDTDKVTSPKPCQFITLPAKNGKIDLPNLLWHLADLGCNEVLVEAGATLAGQFLQQGLVDELVIYIAPKLLGSNARPLFDLPLDTMAAQLGLRIQDIRAVGQDWRMIATIDPEA